MPRKLSELSESTEPLLNMQSSSKDLGSDPQPGSIDEGTLLDELEASAESGSEKPAESLSEGDIEAANEALKESTITPRDAWLEELKDNNVSEQEAAAILDNIMTKGYYTELYRMGGTQFRLRTRTTVDADRTIELLQEAKPETTGVYGHIISRINLACSLVSYGSVTFPHTPPTDDNRALLDKEWRERYRFCSTLPAPAFYALSQVLQKFDTKVSLASDARSLENF